MKKRISNLELLRIVSMFLIVLHHCSLFAFPNIDWAGSFNKTVVDWLSLGGNTAKILETCRFRLVLFCCHHPGFCIFRAFFRKHSFFHTEFLSYYL